MVPTPTRLEMAKRTTFKENFMECFTRVTLYRVNNYFKKLNMGNSKSVSPVPREFSLSKKGLKLDDSAQVEEFCQAIKSTINLQYLRLDGNSFGIEAAKSLAESIAQAKQLRSVNLSDCFTGRMKEEVPVAMEAFCKALLSLPYLRSVDFGDNAFGPIGAQAVSSFISQCATLEELKISNNGLGPEGGKIIAESLQKLALINKSSFKRLYIGRNRLENGSAEAFAKAFEAHCNSLEEVAMFQNGIRPEGIFTLVSAGFSKCSKLRMLDLQDNTFTLKGSEALAAALPKWANLRQLNVGDCLIGSKGALKVIQALNEPITSSLTHLNLQYNEIDDEPAQALADKLESFKSLEQLYLNGNAFSAKGRVGTLILSKLAIMEKSSIVDAWDEMEVDSDEEDEDEENNKEQPTVPESESEVKEKAEDDALETKDLIDQVEKKLNI